ncbi:hypothetical protein HDC90_002967 [Pedobacter sp. AK013]|nr:hypothetical protein [Pedobacter sp. AK013]
MKQKLLSPKAALSKIRIFTVVHRHILSVQNNQQKR